MKHNQITLRQASFIVDNEQKIDQYVFQYQLICREFSKSPFLQMCQSKLWFDILDLLDPVRTRDFSKFLFTKLDEVFERFEVMIKDPDLMRVKEDLTKVIQKCNERGILNKLYDDEKTN